MKDVTLLRFSSTTRFLANAGGARILTRDETQWFTPRRVRQQWSIKRKANEVLCFVFLQYDTLLALYSGRPQSTLLIGLVSFVLFSRRWSPPVCPAIDDSSSSNSLRWKQQLLLGLFECVSISLGPTWIELQLTYYMNKEHRTHRWTVIQ